MQFIKWKPSLSEFLMYCTINVCSILSISFSSARKCALDPPPPFNPIWQIWLKMSFKYWLLWISNAFILIIYISIILIPRTRSLNFFLMTVFVKLIFNPICHEGWEGGALHINSLYPWATKSLREKENKFEIRQGPCFGVIYEILLKVLRKGSINSVWLIVVCHNSPFFVLCLPFLVN